LRLWGLSLANTAQDQAGYAIAANGAARVEVHQTIFTQSHQVIDANNVVELSVNTSTVQQTAGVAIGVRGPLSSVIVGDNHFAGPIGGDYAVDIDAVAQATVESNTFNEIAGTALGVRGPLSSVIVGDNHFLGPISGEGVFLGPISGEGVFRISDNDFEQISTDAMVVFESTMSGQITDNTFRSPIGGDGLSLIGNAETATIAVTGNSFSDVGGTSIMAAEGSASYTMTNNTLSGSGSAGLCLIDLMSPGATMLQGNTITNSVGIGVELLRNSANIEVVANTVTGTTTGEIGPLESGTAMAYGVALFDSKTTSLRNNTISNNATAGAVADMADWGIYINRDDLRGPSNVELQGNNFSNNGTQLTLDLVVQNLNSGAALQSDINPEDLTQDEILPTTRSGRAFRCGNGRLDGAEECDPGIPDETDRCSHNCRLERSDKPFAGGNAFFCATSFTGRVFCKGNNDSGQVNPERELRNLSLQRRTDIPVGVLQIAAGGKAACARLASGGVTCWGGGQLGRGALVSDRQSVGIVNTNDGSLTNVKDIDMGNESACALTHDGSVWCWGEGLLGDGSYPAEGSLVAVRLKSSAERVPGANSRAVENATQVAVGDSFGCFLDTNGDVSCWGLNNFEQLGFDGGRYMNCQQTSESCLNHAFRLEAQQLDNIRLIRVGARHACALTSTNNDQTRVVCWGDNRQRQTRPSDSTTSLPPGPIQNLTNVDDLALGADHSCALLTTGKVVCWGSNVYGQIGNGSQGRIVYEPQTVIKQINTDLRNQLDLFAGRNSNCSLGRNGVLSCWGRMFGQDGDRARIITRLPQ
jgi:cysteine-rich repeat protein